MKFDGVLDFQRGKYARYNYWLGRGTCVACLDDADEKYGFIVSFISPLLGIDGEVLIPRGNQIICKNCIKDFRKNQTKREDR